MTSPPPRIVPSQRCLASALACLVWMLCLSSICPCWAGSIDDDPLKLDFFEKHIRPLFIDHCYACHSSETETSGGLALDSAAGWREGGRSGPTLIPEDSRASLLMRVVNYDDPHLRMPPDNKLKAEQIDRLRTWIDEGAVDPRIELARPPSKETQQLRTPSNHWAYQPVQASPLPAVDDPTPSRNPIDAWIEAKLRQENLTPLPPTDEESLLRRLSFDLLGLPLEEQLRTRFLESASPEARDAIIDEMLQSRRFAERFARHWLDLARYAESLTLRGFILPDAWRYRDYCIDSFAEDKPIDQFLREQIAGDLMAIDTKSQSTIAQRQSQQVAAMFLLLGNHNLEEQDKQQLEMDVVDEQLDTLGKVVLGQTLGCARCHDHKFDPIPTRDYYAMAGILKGSRVLQHENVSKWIERPLPLGQTEAAQFAALESEKAALQKQIAELQKQQPPVSGIVDPRTLKGVVVDDTQAKVVGRWTTSASVKAFVGEGYLHDGNSNPGTKTVTFEPKELPAGRYEVRLAYSSGTNRASRTWVQVHSAEGETTRTVDQRQPGPLQGLWVSLGSYRFEQGGQAFIIVSNQDADGHVIADAIHFLPVESLNDPTIANEPATRQPDVTPSLKSLEQRLQVVEKELALQPKCMSLIREEDAKDLRVHLRGSVHALGAVAPRGFLSVLDETIPLDDTRTMPTNQTALDRMALAAWITSPHQPLTPRVFVNRVWLWMMGEGLVRSPDNFGTTGIPSTHPELLDWLATDFVEHGWSLRHLVRRIATSQAYARSLPTHAAPQSETDPDNRWWWRAHEKRLDAESLRDGMLWMSGELTYDTRGPQYPVKLTADYNQQFDLPCRSLFLPAFRNAMPRFLVAFDAADPSVPVGQRARTTVAQQALMMLNSEWVQQRAGLAAERLCKELDLDPKSLSLPSSTTARQRFLQAAALRGWGRLPTESESQVLHAYWLESAQIEEASSLQASRVIQLMWNSLCYRYLD